MARGKSKTKKFEKSIKGTVLTGYFDKERGVVITEDGSEIPVKGREKSNIRDHDYVEVQVSRFRFKNGYQRPIAGRIVHVLSSDETDESNFISEVLRGTRFTDEIVKILEKQAKKVKAKFLGDRTNLTNLLTITIDPDYKNEEDDAVSCQILANGETRIWIHIADVPEYILDFESADSKSVNLETIIGVLSKQPFTIYTARKAYEMFPRDLTNSCSLKSRKESLAISFVFDIDEKGNVLNFEIFKSIINVDFNLSYDEAQKILDNDSKICKKYSKIESMVKNLNKVVRVLRKKAEEAGRLNFNSEETVIKIRNDEVEKIFSKKDNEAEEIIETLMVLTNNWVTTKFINAPFVYRCHPDPNPEKESRMVAVISNALGYTKPLYKEFDNNIFKNIIKEFKGLSGEQVLTERCIRSLERARYSVNPEPHYGLALLSYAQCTSPIRRAGDFINLLVIHYYLEGSLDNECMRQLKKHARIICESLNTYEAIGAKIENFSKTADCADYMKQFLGNEYDAVISEVKESGIKVKLDNSVKGFISKNSLGNEESLFFYEDIEVLENTENFECFYIGKPIKVKLVTAKKRMKNNMPAGTIIFKLA